MAAGMGFTIPAYAGSSDVQVINGTCGSSSHTAEGPLGSDLTKRQSRFYCDSAVITFFGDYKGHVMVQFAQKESNHSPLLGFSGRLEDDGIMMQLDTVYLVPGQATTVSDGSCKFFFENRQLSGIMCGMKVDETGRRTTAVVVFNVAPGQQQPTAAEPKTQQYPPKMSNPAPSNATPESCAKLGLAYAYHGDTGTSSCVPHAGTQSVSPEASDVLPNGVKESPAGCLAATAHTNDPCKLTYPTGNIMETRADGTTWVTIKKLDIKYQVFSGLPVTGQFQTIIITKLPNGDIIEAPQFEKTIILGNCQSKTYQILGTAITDPNGFFDSGTGPENVARRVIPDTPVDIVFRAFCGAPAPTKP
jgi:hypothetical protein